MVAEPTRGRQIFASFLAGAWHRSFRLRSRVLNPLGTSPSDEDGVLNFSGDRSDFMTECLISSRREWAIRSKTRSPTGLFKHHRPSDCSRTRIFKHRNPLPHGYRNSQWLHGGTPIVTANPTRAEHRRPVHRPRDRNRHARSRLVRLRVRATPARQHHTSVQAIGRDRHRVFVSGAAPIFVRTKLRLRHQRPQTPLVNCLEAQVQLAAQLSPSPFGVSR